MDAPMRLEAEMTIVNAAAQRDALQAALAALPRGAAPAALELDLGAVETIDSAGVQLLLATRASLARDARALVLRNAGAALIDVLDVYGLRALLLPADGGAA